VRSHSFISKCQSHLTLICPSSRNVSPTLHLFVHKSIKHIMSLSCSVTVTIIVFALRFNLFKDFTLAPLVRVNFGVAYVKQQGKIITQFNQRFIVFTSETGRRIFHIGTIICVGAFYSYVCQIK
jgi:hypothetical protein